VNFSDVSCRMTRNNTVYTISTVIQHFTQVYLRIILYLLVLVKSSSTLRFVANTESRICTESAVHLGAVRVRARVSLAPDAQLKYCTVRTNTATPMGTCVVVQTGPQGIDQMHRNCYCIVRNLNAVLLSLV
jgi:hypothetical protein